MTDQFPNMHSAFAPDRSYLRWRERNHVFADLAAFDPGSEYTLLGVTEEPRKLWAFRVTPDLFSVLQIAPVRGHSFGLAREDHPVLLTDRAWTEYFHRAPSVVGRPIRLEERVYTVVGVLPPGFLFPTLLQQPDVLLPLDLSRLPPDGMQKLNVIGRLQSGVSLAQARTEIAAIEKATAATFPPWFRRYSRVMWTEVVPLRETLSGTKRQALMLLAGGALVLLLLLSGNVGALQLARGLSRQTEFAIQLALGAPPNRLRRGLFFESALLCLAAGGLGRACARASLPLLAHWIPSVLIPFHPVVWNSRILLLTVALILASAIATGCLPAFLVSFGDNASLLKTEQRTMVGSRHRRTLESVLLVAQTALAFSLLTSAGLLLASFRHLVETPRGFSTDDLVAAQMTLSLRQYPTASQQRQFFEKLVEEVRTVPGVTAVALTTQLPGVGEPFGTRVAVEGHPLPDLADASASVPVTAVSPNFLPLFQIPLRAGHDLTGSASEANSVLVNEAFVRQFFSPQEHPVGARLLLGVGGASPARLTIQGIVRDFRNIDLLSPAAPAVFRPIGSDPTLHIALVLRTRQPLESLAPALHRKVAKVDPRQALSTLETMGERVGAATTAPRFAAFTAGLLGALALLLATTGLFGTVAYSARRRRTELGVRLALGSTHVGIIWLLVGRLMAWVLAGLTLGILGSRVAGRFLQSLLFGVNPLDRGVLSGTALLLLASALLACLVPTVSALHKDPMRALREP